jgi:hypothetical protein
MTSRLREKPEFKIRNLGGELKKVKNYFHLIHVVFEGPQPHPRAIPEFRRKAEAAHIDLRVAYMPKTS